MYFSVITPSHDPRFLNEAWASLQQQTFTDFEWVVALNNGASWSPPSPDPRIRVVRLPVDAEGVGAIKRLAFFRGQGRVLVELDHDDLLTPNCLQRLHESFEDAEPDFIYSNNAKLGEFTPYNPAYGWRHRAFPHDGRSLVEMHSFPPSARTFSTIWFAPDHVRAWRRDFYHRIGGHDPSLQVLDDHDLLIRTYLRGRCRHLDECLYIYRITGGNTWIKRNTEIQSGTISLMRSSMERLALRQANVNGLPALDLGSGAWGAPGFTSVDLHGTPDVRADLTGMWPWQNGSVGAIRAHDLVEHLPDTVHFFTEAHRVLAPGGWLLLLFPSATGKGAFRDPTHVRYLVDQTVWYFTRPEYSRFIGLEPLFSEGLLEECECWGLPYVRAFLQKPGNLY